MRSLFAAVLGYLVIGATLTFAQQSHLAQSRGSSSKNYLFAKCSLGSNGEVIFKEVEDSGKGRRLILSQGDDHDYDDEDEELDDNDELYCEDEDRKKKGCDTDPKISGRFDFKNLEKFTNYRLSIHEYNDLGKKCKYVGTFFNPNDLKFAPGVKSFKTDCDGKYSKKFKNLGLSISTENSIINRSCVLEKISDRKCKKPFKKCNTIHWLPPYFAGSDDRSRRV